MPHLVKEGPRKEGLCVGSRRFIPSGINCARASTASPATHLLVYPFRPMTGKEWECESEIAARLRAIAEELRAERLTAAARRPIPSQTQSQRQPALPQPSGTDPANKSDGDVS